MKKKLRRKQKHFWTFIRMEFMPGVSRYFSFRRRVRRWRCLYRSAFDVNHLLSSLPLSFVSFISSLGHISSMLCWISCRWLPNWRYVEADTYEHVHYILLCRKSYTNKSLVRCTSNIFSHVLSPHRERSTSTQKKIGSAEPECHLAQWVFGCDRQSNNTITF